MTTNQVIHTCGQCIYARMTDAKDLTQMICRGGPPSTVVLPHPQGVKIRAFYPPVSIEDEGCGAFKPRLAIIATADTTQSNKSN